MSYKFSIGEIAIVNSPGIWTHGKEAMILELPTPGIRRHSLTGVYEHGFYYRVEVEGKSTGSTGMGLGYAEHELRKRPDDQPFSEWFRNTIITDLTDAPLETTMRNVARNLQKFTEAGHGS